MKLKTCTLIGTGHETIAYLDLFGNEGVCVFAAWEEWLYSPPGLYWETRSMIGPVKILQRDDFPIRFTIVELLNRGGPRSKEDSTVFFEEFCGVAASSSLVDEVLTIGSEDDLAVLRMML